MIPICENVDSGFNFSNKKVVSDLFYNICANELNNIKTQGGSVRGNTVARQILCQLFNKYVLPQPVDYNDYVLHHKDYNHNNNDLDNLILIKIGIKENHSKFHRDCVLCAIKDFCNTNKLFSTVQTDGKLYVQNGVADVGNTQMGNANISILGNAISQNKQQIVKYYVDILKKRADRKHNQNEIDYLFASDL